MEIRFSTRSFEESRGEITSHLATLPGQFDSFFEDHVVAARHYGIAIDGADAGFAAIHDESLIAAFGLAPAWRRHGQAVFARLRRQEQVRAALVPTGDEFFLVHALDEHRRFAPQAYNFVLAPESASTTPAARYQLRAATEDDIALIEETSGTFFAPIERFIADGTLYVTTADGQAVGFGLTARSKLYPATASIGMFTIEHARRAGVGTATIALLIAECRRQGIAPIAGCWYYNHRSKATLERAGMYAASRLLRVEY